MRGGLSSVAPLEGGATSVSFTAASVDRRVPRARLRRHLPRICSRPQRLLQRSAVVGLRRTAIAEVEHRAPIPSPGPHARELVDSLAASYLEWSNQRTAADRALVERRDEVGS